MSSSSPRTVFFFGEFSCGNATESNFLVFPASWPHDIHGKIFLRLLTCPQDFCNLCSVSLGPHTVVRSLGFPEPRRPELIAASPAAGQADCRPPPPCYGGWFFQDPGLSLNSDVWLPEAGVQGPVSIPEGAQIPSLRPLKFTSQAASTTPPPH